MKKIKLLGLIIIAYATSAFAQMGVINEDLKILSDDAATGDSFGQSVVLDGGMILIGAPFDDDNGLNSGAAFIVDAATGAQLFKLLPDDGVAGAEFGYAVAMKDGVAAIGARADTELGAGAGAAYLFDAATGTQLYKLVPDDLSAGDEFGNAIDIDGGVVAVGAWRADEFGEASGAAYLFDVASGTQLEKLLPDEGNNFQTFGVSVAIDAGVVAVGARTFFVLGDGYTFAKAFLFDVSSGDLLNTVQPDILNYNGDLGGHFADCLDMKDGLLVVGTPNRSVFFDFSGAIYIFNVGTGEQLHFIYPEDGHDRDHFGISVSLDNDVVTIGAFEDDDSGFDGGSAYYFDAISGDQISKLLASDGEAFDRFGVSVSTQDGLTVIGAKQDDDGGDNAGAAYLFGDISACTGFSLMANITDETADGLSNGSIDLTITGGTEPFMISWSTGDFTEDLSALEAGSYSVTVTDDLGCMATGIYEVAQLCGAVTGLTVSDISTNTATISWNSSGASIYKVQYITTGSSPGVVNTTDTTVTLTGLLPGSNYVFRVRNKCTGTTTTYTASGIFMTDPLRDGMVSGLEVFPNPTTGLLYLQSDMQDTPVLIRDVSGNPVMHYNVCPDVIDLSGLPNGMYILESGSERMIVLVQH